MRTALVVMMGAALMIGCGGSADDCARRLSHGEPIPVNGCCTDDGFCVRPHVYDLDWCGRFAAGGCLPTVYPPAYEGGPRWVLCPPKPDSGLAHEPCPVPNR